MWHRVVASYENGEEFIPVVPDHWLVDKTPIDRYVCWPPKNKLSKAMYDISVTPDSNWEWFPYIKTLFSDKDKKLCEEYDISTDDQGATKENENKNKKKGSKHAKRTSTSSNPQVDFLSINTSQASPPPYPPPFKKTPIPKQVTSTNIGSLNEPGPSTPISLTPNLHDGRLLSTPTNHENVEIRSFEMLKKILKRQSVLEAKMDLVLAKTTEQSDVLRCGTEYRLPEPMETLVDIPKFEREYRRNVEKMEKVLSLKCKNNDVNGSVRCVLSSLMKDPLMCNFNMQGADRSGQSKKEAFSKSFMKTIVVNVVGRFHDCLEEQVLRGVSEYLKHAPKRVQRKKPKVARVSLESSLISHTAVSVNEQPSEVSSPALSSPAAQSPINSVESPSVPTLPFMSFSNDKQNSLKRGGVEEDIHIPKRYRQLDNEEVNGSRDEIDPESEDNDD